eukprot:639617_1
MKNGLLMIQTLHMIFQHQKQVHPPKAGASTKNVGENMAPRKASNSESLSSQKAEVNALLSATEGDEVELQPIEESDSSVEEVVTHETETEHKDVDKEEI